MQRISLLEQTLTCVPATDEWLDLSECRILCRLRFEKRRSDWRLGRWTAKNAVAKRLGLPRDPQTLQAIRIENLPDGAPFAVLRDSQPSVAISISHSYGAAICAVACPAVPLGCDLERVKTRSRAFITDYFTPAEQDLIASVSPAQSDLAATLCWCAKESTLKAIRTGLRVDTRTVTIALPGFDDLPTEGEWRPLKATLLSPPQTWSGWWQCCDGFVKTLVSSPPPLKPLTPEPLLIIPRRSQNASE